MQAMLRTAVTTMHLPQGLLGMGTMLQLRMAWQRTAPSLLLQQPQQATLQLLLPLGLLLQQACRAGTGRQMPSQQQQQAV